MKKVGRFVNKLSVRIITMIILSVTLLSVVSGFFTYQVFSTIMLNETYHTLEQIADSSTYEIAKWNIFSSFLVAGVEDFEEIAGLDEEELEERLDDPKVQAFSAYSDAVARLLYHGMAYDLKEIMLIAPVTEDGYDKYKVVYGQIVGNKAGIYENFMLGEEWQPETREVSQVIQQILAEEIDSDFLVDYQDTDSTMTIYKGVRNADDDLKGIIIVSRSIQEMVDTWRRYLTGNAIVGSCLVLLGTIGLWFYLRIRVVKPVNRLALEADRFAQEIVKKEQNLADQVGKITEIRFLAKSIDKLEEDTVNNIDEISRMSRESERIDTELSLAANLQMSVLPKSEKFSGRKEFDVAAEMIPAREVGGDFYDFFLLDDTHLVLLIADVSDKGVGAAFFMAVSKTMLKARVSMGGSPAEVITFVENRLSEDNEAGMFVTAWLGIVDLVTGEVNACNAGHNFPAILHKDTDEGYKIEKTEHGPPICFLPGLGHKEYSFRLQPGDRIFLYTDGVTEAKSPTEERFGNERLIQALNEDQAIGNSSLILRVKSAVERFAEGEPQFDDMTMVSFTYLGTGKQD